MKRVKKNQVIITALAIMIAVAGYINYAGNISDIISVSSKSGSKVVNTNTENLTNIVNDTAIDKASKTEAINELAKIAEYSEKEAAIELLLEAKGFNDVVASVAEDSVDIVINQQTLENSQKAQIEDIAKRKTGVTSDKITINVIK